MPDSIPCQSHSQCGDYCDTRNERANGLCARCRGANHPGDANAAEVRRLAAELAEFKGKATAQAQEITRLRLALEESARQRRAHYRALRSLCRSIAFAESDDLAAAAGAAVSSVDDAD
jgi:hypothetical protein